MATFQTNFSWSHYCFIKKNPIENHNSLSKRNASTAFSVRDWACGPALLPFVWSVRSRQCEFEKEAALKIGHSERGAEARVRKTQATKPWLSADLVALKSRGQVRAGCQLCLTFRIFPSGQTFHRSRSAVHRRPEPEHPAQPRRAGRYSGKEPPALVTDATSAAKNQV